MNAVKQAFYLFATLLLLASSGWYFASSSPKFKLDAHTLLTTTDTIIHGVTIRKYDQLGKLENSMQSPLVRHIPKNNTHWLKSPHITIIQQNQPAWEINAEQAVALRGGEQITFSRQVRIHQAKGEKSTESTFTTEEVTYYPKTKQAYSSKHVLFEQPGNRVQSKGMRADLEKKHIQLLGQAKGIYDPKHG